MVPAGCSRKHPGAGRVLPECVRKHSGAGRVLPGALRKHSGAGSASGRTLVPAECFRKDSGAGRVLPEALRKHSGAGRAGRALRSYAIAPRGDGANAIAPWSYAIFRIGSREQLHCSRRGPHLGLPGGAPGAMDCHGVPMTVTYLIPTG